ncbi:hypothetical protein DTO166G4_8735 [Paecilomyces variotii]|nr:hypothetical protein DTO166G4_8735 [Paecilomyces variotii]KAJ9230249.1 hypothetical protein DTO166G5_7427 [Paecilomyces variotii]
MKVLVTGGSGFVGAHCVVSLLEHSHKVVATVRSHEKGQKLLENHPGVAADRLSYVVVEDIAFDGAFDKAVQSEPPFDAVFHCASPFHFDVTRSVEKDLLEPAINGTMGILKSIQQHAPNISKVVITSSMAAVLRFAGHPEVYTEDCWNPVTWEEAIKDATVGYPASKTFAERAAWDFVEKEKPNFTLSVINPPLIFGPVVHHISSLKAINTSNIIFRDFIRGNFASGLPPRNRFPDWVDVRDVALAHVRALEMAEAVGKRFILVAGQYSEPDIARTIYDNFPDLRGKLPRELENDPTDNIYRVDASRSREILKMAYRPLEQCVADTVKSLLPIKD